jgi:Flp pilus assembly protein TadD
MNGAVRGKIMKRSMLPRHNSYRPLALLLIGTSLALAGCQSNSAAVDPMTTGSTNSLSLKDAAAAGERWKKDPGNIELGLAYAGRLKALGQTSEQLSVLGTLASRNPQDGRLLGIYGKELLAAGQIPEAADMLQRATASGQADWKTYSALGSAYDQQGRYADARTQYAKALELSPNEMSVLNNMGMSYALEGNLGKAETTLRQALSLPGSSSEPRIRQNLALVVGLQGRFEESKQIASQDLPPDQVEANMAYLQQMLSQPNTWQKLRS